MGTTSMYLGGDKSHGVRSSYTMTFYRHLAGKSQRQSAQKVVIASAKRLDGP